MPEPKPVTYPDSKVAATPPPSPEERLRAPFPNEQVGKLPRIWCPACRETKGKVCERHTKIRCDVCRNTITSAHLHLDYVGHAAVTSRLLEIDPDWNWEPVAFNDAGFPAIDKEGGLWIRLTVLGRTRLGYGTTDRNDIDSMKILIGDALRNAAMRFGVALDLWSKEDLSAKAEAEAEQANSVQRGEESQDAPDAPPGRNWAQEAQDAKTLEEVLALAAECNKANEFKGVAKARLQQARQRLERAGGAE